jgi:hypothetical protein
MKILDAVVPLFGVSERSTPSLIGTGFLVAHAESRILVGAAHVADEQSETPLFVPSENGVLHKIEAPAVKTLAPDGNRDLDKIDVAFWDLPKELSAELERARWFLPTLLLQPGAPSSPSHQYSFVGYPHKGTKTIYGTTRIRAVPESFTGKCVSQGSLISVGGLPNKNIAVEFDHKLVQFGPRLVVPKDRHGMSGGPVFGLTHGAGLEGVPKVRIVGVAIEHHKKEGLLLATRIDSLLQLLAGYFGTPKIPISAATIRTIPVTEG